MKKVKWEFFKGKNGDWYFHLKAKNGQITAPSEGYSSKQAAQKGMTDMIRLIAEAGDNIEYLD